MAARRGVALAAAAREARGRRAEGVADMTEAVAGRELGPAVALRGRDDMAEGWNEVKRRRERGASSCLPGLEGKFGVADHRTAARVGS